jgi:hypothetical protein
MESVMGSVKLMLFIYALAAVIALAMAWLIKYLFVAIRFQSNRADARKGAKGGTPLTHKDAAPKGTA